MFIVSVMLKEARKEAKMTQGQLAKKQEPRRVRFKYPGLINNAGPIFNNGLISQ